MTPGEWNRAKALFESALAQEPTQRAAFLAQNCPDDNLRQEVEKLLVNFQEAGSFLSNPVLPRQIPTSGQIKEVPAEAFPEALPVSHKVGPYEIFALIGSGGMGHVYKARDTRLDRIVAIKFSKAQFTQRFEREARAVAALNHPHICQLYDVGPNYLVFEFIDGARLKGPMPAAEAVQIATQISEALAEAHAHGVIHRDLKPANILLTAHGVKVLDFGLAKQSREGERADDETRTMDLTVPGVVMGTPAYMAPEQWQGKPADTRSDVYAFGCVLHEMLTGVAPGRDRAPLKHPVLEGIVRKCLAGDPAKRFQSAAELKTALAQAANRRVHKKYAALVVLAIFAAGTTLFRQRVHAAPKLTDRDTLVVADFDNKTGDSVFDTALKQALAFQLAQSPFLKAMDDAEIRQALKLSGRSPDARVTGEIARDICIREGQKAAIEGSIAVLGSRYLIGLQAVNCQTGETFAREQTEANSKDRVVEALARVTNSMRAKLGESLSTLQGENRAYRNPVTTSSLEALQAFYMGDAEWSKNGMTPAAIPMYRRATELDPNFAFAFAVLGSAYWAAGDLANAKTTMEKAFALRSHASERERLFIEQYYYKWQGDSKKDREICELLTRQFPRDPVFHKDLGNLERIAGEPEKALAEAEKAIQNGPKIVQGYRIAVEALTDLNRIDESKAVAAKAIANGLDVPVIHDLLLYLAYATGDGQTQQQEARWLTSNGWEASRLWEQANHAFALGHFQQAEALTPKIVEAATRQGFASPQQWLVFAVRSNALAGNCRSVAVSLPPLGPADAVQKIAKALCDPKAARKVTEQQTANGSAPISGPDAYLRGVVFLETDRPADAASVFSRMVDRKAANWGAEYPAAQVGLARAAKAMGDLPRARKAYEDFFAFWKDADPDIPLLRAARKEYAALK
ncbi:MAG TPA: serine/threonine-protein kinase [Bryobacteraceae bacterium]|nr:serine/threonine-protein kinase [Bryobacteraceae bacterium]